MTEAEFIDISRDAIVVMLKVSAPILLVGLVVGLIIAVFQTLTSIQEQTLTFVPKMLLVFVSMLMFLPFMMATMNDFWKVIMDRVIAGGG